MQKILVICGPTATGKTGLALRLAKEFNGEIVSADSRQVYKGMDIGTGKDLPQNSELHITDNGTGFYLIEGIRVWGYDLAEPGEDFSVANYMEIADSIVTDILARKKMPIIAGGTGFYIKALIDGVETATVPREEELRKRLDTKEPVELFEELRSLDPTKARSLNSSDIKNPRRLIRAIEVARWKLANTNAAAGQNTKDSSDKKVLFIGLRSPKERLDQKIKERVLGRIQKGQEEEIKTLLAKGVTWNMQSMHTLGYREWKDHFGAGQSIDAVIKNWTTDEIKYAKRQMTWFKKDQRIIWFDTDDANFNDEVEKLVRKWQNDVSYAEKD